MFTLKSFMNREALQGTASKPSGYLLHKPSLYILTGVFILAAWKGQWGVAILLALIFSAAGLAALWSRVSLVGVRCQRTIGEKRLFPGESTQLTLQITNRKPLPLTWIRLDDEFPAEMAADEATSPGSRAGVCLLSRSASMLWYSKVSWRCSLRGRRRGYYRIGPMGVTSGDIFGFYPRSAKAPSEDHVIVYPQIFPLEELGVPPVYPLGENKALQRIFQDPTRTLGLRDYRPGDSLKHIHWKASARHSRLHVKVFEFTTNLKISLLLAVDTFQGQGSRREENFELAVSTAASIAYYLIENGTPAGLFANTCLADSGLPASIPPGGSQDQLMHILDALAKVTLSWKEPFETFLQREREELPPGSTLILITAQEPESFPWWMKDLKESGYQLLLLAVGSEGKNLPEGAIPVHRILHPGSLRGIHSGVSP